MLTPKQIMDSVAGLLKERFPGEPVYQNITPIGFARPSSLVTYASQKMADATCATVEVEAGVAVTLFVAVDEYHNSHLDELARRMTGVQELFAVEGLEVEDRALHVVGNTGIVNYDFAEVSITLRYHDERPTKGRDWPLMEDVRINATMKE